MIALTDENFKEEIENEAKPILVDFWSASCMPCFALLPTLEKLAEEYKDKVIFAKININEAPLTAQEYEIDRIPAVFLFREGKLAAGFIGVQPEPVIREWLEKNIKK